MAIADGRSCPVSGEGVVQVSSQLSLENFFFVPDFLLICFQLVLLLNSYVVMSPFSLSIARFRICRQGEGLVWAVSMGMVCTSLFGMIYLEDYHLWHLHLSLLPYGTTG